MSLSDYRWTEDPYQTLSNRINNLNISIALLNDALSLKEEAFVTFVTDKIMVKIGAICFKVTSPELDDLVKNLNIERGIQKYYSVEDTAKLIRREMYILNHELNTLDKFVNEWREKTVDLATKMRSQGIEFWDEFLRRL